MYLPVAPEHCFFHTEELIYNFDEEIRHNHVLTIQQDVLDHQNRTQPVNPRLQHVLMAVQVVYGLSVVLLVCHPILDSPVDCVGQAHLLADQSNSDLEFSFYYNPEHKDQQEVRPKFHPKHDRQQELLSQNIGYYFAQHDQQWKPKPFRKELFGSTGSELCGLDLRWDDFLIVQYYHYWMMFAYFEWDYDW